MFSFIPNTPLIGGGLPHRVLRNLLQRYEPIMYLQPGQVPTVVISSPIIAQEIFKTHDRAFANRPQFNFLVQRWSSPLVEFDKMRSAFGKICKERNEFITLLKEVLVFAGGFDVADLFPSWKLLHNISGVKSRLVKAHQKIDAIMENIINEPIENKAAGKKGNGEFGDEDSVDVFLRVKENAELQFPITNEHTKAVISDIFIAGTQTSSTTIIWALSELTMNPNVMAKAQSEVRQVFKGKKNYGEEDIEKLTYLKLVIKETLRPHTPVPLIGPRECREKTNIDGHTIPYKARVLVNAWALARDLKS
ncbi:hypothetical protein MTR67_027503 [Solanum verrucosum]|uniref:Cytochrome P450 n=1 Tax=Solanum verrucosum TaxID=315347 RepID=A0AAF0U061_SOLVR|nr:hypothetical protein MTR67_027503 [Solanum verrucosum]